MDRRELLVALAVGLAGCSDTVRRRTTGSPEGGDDERLHAKGTMEIVVDGEPVDLTADRFQVENAEEELYAFHFHDGDEYWYMEGYERVTFAEAIDYIPGFQYDRRDGARVIEYDDTVYDERDDGTELTFHVDGEAVDPDTYEVHDGDHLRLEITTAS